jgi:hypothetical protein
MKLVVKVAIEEICEGSISLFHIKAMAIGLKLFSQLWNAVLSDEAIKEREVKIPLSCLP